MGHAGCISCWWMTTRRRLAPDVSRRARKLTEDDRAVWRAYTDKVRALPGKALAPGPVTPSVSVTPPPRPAAPPAPRPVLPPPPITVGLPPPGLDGKRWKELRRGRLRPERMLDLHGKRAQDAYAAVRAFLAEAQADGLRCVGVVTGKGSSGEGGVLRRELPHWLNAPDLRPLLLGAAHPHTSNPGAVHLLLRRRR